MKAYVLGAGASVPIYPLGKNLFEDIDQYIRSSGCCFNKFDHKADWPALKQWLMRNRNPLLREAYRNRNIEQIFTVLDLADTLLSDSLDSMFKAIEKGESEAKQAEANNRSLKKDIKDYRGARMKLLWAMEHYLLDRNNSDLEDFSSDRWRDLKRLGALLDPDDIVITLNYDSTIERVLFDLKKWTPSDGYGTDIVFQQNDLDKTPVTFPPSKVKVLHLHGAVGWYAKPVFSPDFTPSGKGGGGISRDKLSAAPLETEIALDPLLLRGLGIKNVDASLPSRPPSESQIMLHPSFLKEYGGADPGNRIFKRLWRMASDALRRADEVIIIGYSLPPADSAAWTLLHTGCERGRTTIVNPSRAVLRNRYFNLIHHPVFPKEMDLSAWLDSRVSSS